MKNTIAGLENLTVTTIPAPSNDHPPQASLPMDPSYCMTDYSASYRPYMSTMEGYYYYDEGAGTNCSAYPAYPVSSQMGYPFIPLPYGDYGSYSSMDLPGTGWSQSSTDFANFPAPQTPDFLPIQFPSEPLQNKEDVSPPILKKKSKELVGMGLYDRPDQDSVSSLDLLTRFSTQRESMGKGLKLEETWQPPQDTEDEEEVEDEAEEEEEEAYSTDEADEDVLPIVTPTSDARAPTAFYPACGDLSNQTFFFDSDDPYANCLAFQAIQECRQPKVPETAYGSTENLYF